MAQNQDAATYTKPGCCHIHSHLYYLVLPQVGAMEFSSFQSSSGMLLCFWGTPPHPLIELIPDTQQGAHRVRATLITEQKGRGQVPLQAGTEKS